jgi:hypothetical protein
MRSFLVRLAKVLGVAVVLAQADVALAIEPPPASLANGGFVRRSTAERTLTAEDRNRIGELGLQKLSSAAVIVRKIPRSEGPRQLARLEALARAPEGFAPSGACDEMVGQGEASALCSGHVSGPMGNVPVRMPVAAKLKHGADGSLHLSLSNPRPLEAKPLFSWSSVVSPEHLQVSYELFPDPDGWLVYVRVGVEMSSHESSATTISDAMLRLEAWLTRELART